MSLRHTIKTLLSGPQTQAPPSGGYGYGQAPGHPPQQYGAPAPYGGYPQSGPVAHTGPVGSYALPQGQPMMAPNAQAYGYAPPQQQPPQMFAPPPQQQPQYHPPQMPLNPGPAGPVAYNNINNNSSSFPPPNALSYAPPSVPPPTMGHQFQPQQPFQQYSPTPPAVANFQPQPHAQAQAQTQGQYGAPPPVPSATHPTYQQPTTSPVPHHQQPTSNPALQYTQAPPVHQDPQQPPRTPLSPPPPYMRFEQPSLSQAVSSPNQPPPASPQNPVLSYAPPLTNPQPASLASNIQQQQPDVNPYNPGAPQRKSSISKGDTRDAFTPQPQQTQVKPESSDTPQRPASTKPQSGQPPASEGVPPVPTTPHGIIHPSMLAQWSAVTATKSGQIPNLPSAQSQTPPKSTTPKPSPMANTNAPPPQPTYPGGKGHKPTGSVNRSFTFSKKNADGSPNWNGTLLTIDGMSSETFTRFVNGVYNFAGQDEDPLGLTPDQMRVLLDRLDMPDQRNYPKRYALTAQTTNAADPTSFVNTSLIQYYSIFDVTYITESNFMPIVTRDGFQQYMTTEVLINPSAMHGRFLRLLANFGHQIIDPFTKKPFGNVQFERECLPPVPNDQYIARDKKQVEALQAREEANSQYYSGAQQSSGNPHSSSWGI